MLDGEEYFTCVCGSYDHTLRFILDLDRLSTDFQYPAIYAEVGMNHYLPWYKRIWIGIKYIFGYNSPNQYGCWEINAQSDDPERIISMIHKLKDEIHAVEQKEKEKKEKKEKNENQ